MDNDLLLKYSFINENDYDAVKGSDWPAFEDFQMHRQVPKWVYDEIDTMLFQQTPFDHPSFCVLPWHGKEIYYNGKTTHCCLLTKPYDINKIRSDMKQGIRPKECRACWQMEDNGLLSDRKIKNSALDFYLQKNIHDIMKDATDEKPLMIKLSTSFTCNGACIYCSSEASSHWNIIERKIDQSIPIKTYQFIGLANIDKEVDLSAIKTLTILGGEPLLERNNFEILERLLEIGNTDVFISLVSNASISLSQRYRQMLSRFKNLNLCLSLDGRHGVFEYQRWPLKWADVEKNLEIYRELTDNISVNCTITNISLLYYNDAKAWFRSQAIPWRPNLIYQPAVFQPSNLPMSAKRRLCDLLDADDYNAIIGDACQEESDNWPQFLSEITKQDQVKGINIRDFVPEFCDLVGI